MADLGTRSYSFLSRLFYVFEVIGESLFAISQFSSVVRLFVLNGPDSSVDDCEKGDEALDIKCVSEAKSVIFTWLFREELQGKVSRVQRFVVELWHASWQCFNVKQRGLSTMWRCVVGRRKASCCCCLPGAFRDIPGLACN